MAGALVDRATSDVLIRPDWSLNMEICDVLNHYPGQAKDVVKVIKKRLRHKNPKVQLLALTLLETVVKNSGDIVHMHVAEKDILHEMVKTVKKKRPDHHVKERILILIDSWQEAFGGPRARYPQYFAAYQELLRAGAVFPQRSESSAPIFTPPQTHPLQSYPPSVRSPDNQNKIPESSVASDFPVLSLTEIQNARGIMDVLAEMINALDPGNREALKQDVIIDLVSQCRNYRQRVVHLVNTTGDEELLSQGLVLNDDLQKVLAKHDAIAAGLVLHAEKRKSLQALVEVEDSSANKEPNQRLPTTSANNQPALQQASLPGPPSNASATSSTKVDPTIDLLSGDNYSKPATENLLALVPASGPVTNSASDQNILAFADMFPHDSSSNTNNDTANSFDAFPPQPTYPANLQLQAHRTPEPSPFTSGGIPGAVGPQFEQPSHDQGVQLKQVNTPWHDQVAPSYNQQQQPLGYDQGSVLPPPPWEAQSSQGGTPALQTQPFQTPVQAGQPVGPQPQPTPGGQIGALQPHQMLGAQFAAMQPQLMQGDQLVGMYPPMENRPMTTIYPQQMQMQMQMLGGQAAGARPQPILTSYGYGHQPDAQFYNPSGSAYPPYSTDEFAQRMHGLSVHDHSMYQSNNSSYQIPTSSSYLQQSSKPLRPEDKLFGDLVNMAKTKQSKTSTGNLETV